MLDHSRRSTCITSEQDSSKLELVLALGAMSLHQARLRSVSGTAIFPSPSLSFALRTLSGSLAEDDLSALARELLCVAEQGQCVVLAAELALD